MTRSLRRHATKLCLAGFPVAGSLLSQEAMTGFLRLATKIAMNRAARTAERRPRRVPLSRLTGARPTGAAILRRVGRLGQFGNEGAQRYRAAAGHTVQRFDIGLPDRAVTDRFVDLPVTFGQPAPRQPPMPRMPRR